MRTLLRKILKKLRQGSWFPFYYTLWHRTKVDPRTVLLESRHGQALESNIYALLKELAKEEYHAFRIVVPVHKKKMGEFRKKIENGGLRVDRLVPFGGLSYYHELCRAGFLINDISFPGRFIKKEEQKMLNVWHGTPLKRMGKDDPQERGAMGNMMRSFLQSDWLLYPNRYMEEKMTTSFMLDALYEGRILHTGYPRNDVFFSREERSRIREKYGLEGKRVLAWLPTYRGRSLQVDHQAAVQARQVHLKRLLDALEEDEILLYKPHPLEHGTLDPALAAHPGLGAFPEGEDTSAVLSACDLLITDYSSVFFDFANTGRPVILFIYDLEEYTRGLYMKVDELPFPSARTIEELIRLIKAPESDDGRPAGEYSHEAGFRERYETWENGHGSRDALQALLFDRVLCETAVPVRDGRKNILLYAGNLAQNGVTAAFCNLYTCLTDGESERAGQKYRFFICFRTGSVMEEPSRMNRIPPGADLYPLASEMNLDPLTGLVQAVYLKTGFKGLGIGKRISHAYGLEWRKHFGNVSFSHLIHYNGYENYIIRLMMASGVPWTIWVHSNMEEEIRVRKNPSRPLLRDAYRQADHVVCVSRDGTEAVRTISGRTSGVQTAGNCQHPDLVRQRGELPLAFDENTRSNVSEEQLSRILFSGERKGPVFICLGRFSPEKGQERLLRAFEKFRKEKPDAWLIMAGGSGLQYELLCSQVKESPAGDHVVLILSMSNPMPLLKACDCLIVPSLYEGCPVVPFEADFLDIPCFCTDVPGCRELMETWGGTLVPADEAGLVQGMEWFTRGKIPLMHIDARRYNREALSVFYGLLE